MEIIYTDTMTGAEYNELRLSVNWKTLTPGQAERGLAHTAFVVAARDGERIVGMGRMLFDFGYTAYLGDIIVHPEYQGKGIGTEIVNRLKDMTMEAAEQGDKIMFILVAAKGKEGFYEKFGFKVRPNDFNGCGMSMWREKE
ncbi:MAG: GNAT family N-acetyltransferase [Lachnospiraceae bacterium]|nr:GNAT family N-acetyltransferase [Lachnospiraceae bacterium]